MDVVLDRAVGSDRSIALRPSRRIESLSMLRHALVEHSRTRGIAERAGYRFSPHLTLGYRTAGPFQERIAPVGWRADEVVLIHSHLGRTRHVVLGRWPLKGARNGQLELF